MAKASVDSMTPGKSKVQAIRDLEITEDPIALEIESERPIVALADPHQIVPHDQVTKKVKESIIGIYGEEFFHGREWDLKTLKRLSRAITHPRENLVNSIAQICGPNCPFKDSCVMDIAGRPPLGERCPRELKLAHMFIEEYLLSMSARLGLEPDELREDVVAYNMIIGVVETDIVNMRLNSTIGEDGMVQSDPAAINSETGEVYYKDEEAVAVRIKDRVQRRRDNLLKQLLATPEMQAKYRRPKDSDAVRKAAEVLEQLSNRIKLLDLGAKEKDE